MEACDLVSEFADDAGKESIIVPAPITKQFRFTFSSLAVEAIKLLQVGIQTTRNIIDFVISKSAF